MTTREGQKAAVEMRAQWTPKATELEKKEAALKADKERLEGDSRQFHGWWLWRRTMSAKEKSRRQKELDVRTRALMRERDDDRAAVDNEQKRIIGRIGKRMLPLLERYAKEHGYSVVLDSGNQDGPVVIAGNDITAEIVKLYDAAYPVP